MKLTIQQAANEIRTHVLCMQSFIHCLY